MMLIRQTPSVFFLGHGLVLRCGLPFELSLRYVYIQSIPDPVPLATWLNGLSFFSMPGEAPGRPSVTATLWRLHERCRTKSEGKD